MSLNRTIGLEATSDCSPRQKVKSKLSLQILVWYLLGCHCTRYTVLYIRCPQHPPPPSTFVFSLPLTYSLSSSYPALSCELRPVSLGPSVAIIYQSQARVPIGFSFLLATPLPRQPPAPCHICDAEANVLCPCAAGSQRQFMARTGADSTVRG